MERFVHIYHRANARDCLHLSDHIDSREFWGVAAENVALEQLSEFVNERKISDND